MISNTSKTVITVLAIGGALAFAKLIYLFFDYYNIIDFLVFLFAGFGVGRKVPSNRFAFGLLLALPTLSLCLLLVINLGYSSIMNGVGTAYAVSFIIIPLAICIGIFISAKRDVRRKV